MHLSMFFPRGEGGAGLTGEFDIFFFSHVKFPTHSLKKHVKYPRVRKIEADAALSKASFDVC